MSSSPLTTRVNDTTSIFHGLLAWNVQTAQNCSEATGFAFHSDTNATTAQLRAMCSNSDCIVLVNRVIVKYLNPTEVSIAPTNATSSTEMFPIATDETSIQYTLAWQRFAEPMLNYCTFNYIPNQPCPPDPLAQLLQDMQPIVETCERQANVSLVDRLATSSEPKRSLHSMCTVPECDNILRRLYLKVFWPTACPLSQTDITSVKDSLVYEYMHACNTSERFAWRNMQTYAVSTSLNESLLYTYLPGPLPLVPNPLASPLHPTAQPTVITSVQSDPKHSNTLMYVLVSGLMVVALIVGLLAYVYRRRGYRQRDLATQEYVSVDDSTLESDPNRGPYHANNILKVCPNVPVHELTDIRILGGGGFGIVYLVRQSSTNQLLASKRRNHATSEDDDQLNCFLAEIALAASLFHPRIVRFVGVAGLHKTDLQALFEYMPGGDLRRYLDTHTPASVPHSWTLEKLRIAIDVADALVYLHAVEPIPVVHRDLKSRNVLLTTDKRAKVGDFGASRTESAEGTMTTGIGTCRWVAPEVIVGGGEYTTASDLYSLGVVLAELDTHRLPYSELIHVNGERLADFAVLVHVAMERKQPSFRPDCPSRLYKLARKCLSYDPNSRPTAVEVAAELRAIQSTLGWNQ